MELVKIEIDFCNTIPYGFDLALARAHTHYIAFDSSLAS
jgi:hypothetical protein